MKTSKVKVATKQCESCVSWGYDSDKGTFRKCLIKEEYVAVCDYCGSYIKKIILPEDIKGE